MLYDEQVWPLIHDSHLWVFDKLILSRRLGHLCGPACVSVPKPDFYVVRPCVNLSGMSAGAEVRWIEDSTDHLPPGYFWQEVFQGRHLSIDYQNGVQVRSTEGFKVDGSLSKFSRWVVTDDRPKIPDLITDLTLQYEKVNVEMIGDKIIEVHLRGNPNFEDGAVECIPVWHGEWMDLSDLGYQYVEDSAADRVGFWKKFG